MSYIDQLRGTGRTTRMLEHAKKLVDEGRRVWILVYHTSEILRIRSQLGTSDQRIQITTPELARFDWKAMRIQGLDPNTVILIDHHAIEDRFHRLLDAYHAYDL